MNFNKREFLAMVAQLVEDNKVDVIELVTAANHGQEARYKHLNELRCEAEVAATFLYGLVPESQKKKQPVMFTRVKKALINSGMFGDTETSRQLEKEISVPTEEANV